MTRARQLPRYAFAISGRPSRRFCIDWLFAAIGRMP